MSKLIRCSFILLTTVILSLESSNIFSQYNPDSLEAHIGRIVKKYVDSNRAGMVVGVIRKEGSDYINRRYSFGHIRRDTTSPRPDSLTIFRIGSCTKSFTATILSMLIQQGGQLQLNDPVENHIPLNIVRAPFYVSGNDTVKMKIIDLATHYSALPDDPIAPVNDSTTYQMMYNYLNNHHLSRPPGQCFLYSNLGVSFLGVVLTHTLGNIIDSLFIQRICNPLNMPDTRITLTPEQESRRARGYLSNGDSVGYFKSSWPAFYAAGGLYTTLRDFMKYLEFNMGLSNLGMQNVLDSAHKIRRVTNDTCLNPNATGRVGLVWQMNVLNPQVDSNFYFTWKDGGVPGFVSFICFSENQSKNLNAGVVMMTNVGIPCDQLARDILKYLNSDSLTGVNHVSEKTVSGFILHQNYPNPFNPVTKINFDVISDQIPVRLEVFDLLGKKIATLLDEKLSPGSHSAEWNASKYPSGIYYYKLTSGKFSETKKMTVVK